MIKLNVPHFVDDTKDNARCVQACIKMVLKYFLPQKSFSWKQLDKITHKVPKKGTWWFGFFPELVKIGFEVIEYETPPNFYRNLHAKGLKYFYKTYPKSVAEWYIHKSNIKQIIKFIPKVLRTVKFYKKKPTLKDIKKRLKFGYLLIVDINARIVSGRPGFASHAVVVTGYDKRNVYVNDPANAEGKNLKVPRRIFLKAWHSRGLAAFKLRKA